MKVEKLSLANFRGFEQIDLEFEEDITVIAGVNGVGKSAILQALASLFSHTLPKFTPSNARPIAFSDGDIFCAELSLSASAIFSIQDDSSLFMDIHRVKNSKDDDIRRLAWLPKKFASMPLSELRESQILTGDLDADETEAILNQQKDNQQQPSVIYFSTKRLLPGSPRSLPNLKAFDITNAYGFALQDREVEAREFMHWFRVFESEIGGAQGKRVIDNLKKVVTTFLPDFTNLRIEEEPTLRLLIDKAGTPLILNQLSDGERGLLAVIFDIARRLSIANPELEDPIAEGKAIILIDEIELHLHPKWQREVLHRLTTTFKNCQFIVTTHSPQILGEVESRCIRLLYFEDGKVKTGIPDRSKGLDSSRVLEELMDAPARHPGTESTLRKLAEQIDEENFEDAKKSIQELLKILPDDDPELTRARTLMAFLEADE